jgi:leucyl aminopeptidase
VEIAVASAAPANAVLARLVADPPSPDVADLVAAGEASPKRGKARLVRSGDARVVATGVGDRDAVDTDALRDAAAAAVQELQATSGGVLAWPLDPTLPLSTAEQARAVIEGALLGGYDPGAWKTAAPEKAEVGGLALVTDAHLAEVVRDARTASVWTNAARDLSNRPGNDLTPARFAEYATEAAEGIDGLTAETLDIAEMRALGMGALLGVGAGSRNEPRVIDLRWQPPARVREDLVLGLVGKGVTFDTGGISLKPATHMENMKGDMGGAAAVVAGIAAMAELELPVEAVAVVAAVENMPGGSSMRPGDILTAANGKTIEVTNTDAEGRLVLADALWYARERGATHVVDFATLTGAMSLALGDQYAGAFANDRKWLDAVVAAGASSGDYVWPFPLHPRYRRLIDSAFADLKNSSLRRLGSPVYAASFLEEFAGEGPWAHVDIAGPSYLTWSRGDYLSQVGGTGFGVRLIVELARQLSR